MTPRQYAAACLEASLVLLVIAAMAVALDAWLVVLG